MLRHRLIRTKHMERREAHISASNKNRHRLLDLIQSEKTFDVVNLCTGKLFLIVKKEKISKNVLFQVKLTIALHKSNNMLNVLIGVKTIKYLLILRIIKAEQTLECTQGKKQTLLFANALWNCVSKTIFMLNLPFIFLHILHEMSCIYVCICTFALCSSMSQKCHCCIFVDDNLRPSPIEISL